MESFSSKKIDEACEFLSELTGSYIQFVRSIHEWPGCRGVVTIDRMNHVTETICEAIKGKHGFWEMDSDNVVAKYIMKSWID